MCWLLPEANSQAKVLAWTQLWLGLRFRKNQSRWLRPQLRYACATYDARCEVAENYAHELRVNGYSDIL